jgi:acylphosphatase
MAKPDMGKTGTLNVKLRIEGRVQGVGYRYWVVRQAGLIGIEGWVRNRRDGSVEAVLSGAPDAVLHMVSTCREGPPMARVTSVRETPHDGPVEAGFHTCETG